MSRVLVSVVAGGEVSCGFFSLLYVRIPVIANSERDLTENADSISRQWQPYTESLLPVSHTRFLLILFRHIVTERNTDAHDSVHIQVQTWFKVTQSKHHNTCYCWWRRILKTSLCNCLYMCTLCKWYVFWDCTVWIGQMSEQHTEALITALPVCRESNLAILVCMKPKVMPFGAADSLHCIQNWSWWLR